MSPSPHQTDMSPEDIDYGYGQASPDVSRLQESRFPSPTAEEDYGYEEASPDIRSSKPRRRWSMIASTATNEHGPMAGRGRLPRRSSLRQEGATPTRRASMGDVITVYLPGQEQPQIRRQSITFDLKVKVKNIEAISRMTDSPRTLWFQAEEYNRMRRNSWDLVQKVERGRTGLGDRKYCIRGLEKMLDREAVTQTKFNAWDSVFDEQDIQRDRGCYDDEYMAKLYSLSSIGSVKAAQLRGKQDEQDVTNYLSNTRRMCRRLSC